MTPFVLAIVLVCYLCVLSADAGRIKRKEIDFEKLEQEWEEGDDVEELESEFAQTDRIEDKKLQEFEVKNVADESTNPDGSFDPDAFLKNLNSGHHKPGSMGGKNVNKFSSPPKKGGSMIFVDLLEPTDENRKASSKKVDKKSKKDDKKKSAWTKKQTEDLCSRWVGMLRTASLHAGVYNVGDGKVLLQVQKSWMVDDVIKFALHQKTETEKVTLDNVDYYPSDIDDDDDDEDYEL